MVTFFNQCFLDGLQSFFPQKNHARFRDECRPKMKQKRRPHTLSGQEVFAKVEEADASRLSQTLAFRGLGRSGCAYDYEKAQSAGLDQQHPSRRMMKLRRDQLVARTGAGLRNWAIIFFSRGTRTRKKNGSFQRQYRGRGRWPRSARVPLPAGKQVLVAAGHGGPQLKFFVCWTVATRSTSERIWKSSKAAASSASTNRSGVRRSSSRWLVCIEHL